MEHEQPGRYALPTFLSRADRSIFGLSLGQIPLAGLAGFGALGLVTLLPYGAAVQIGVWLLLMAVALLLIIARPWGRSLAGWGRAVYRYRRAPRVLRWQAPKGYRQ